MSPFNDRHDGERGAILIHVALAIVALMGLSTFVIDYGAYWVARRQAQNASDAGALAGAIALAYDDFSNRDVDGWAYQSALAAASANVVFGQAPTAASVDISFPSAPLCPDDDCIRVDVHRSNVDGNANPLPVFMGRLIGLTDQNVRASATAQVAAADSSDCLRPFAVPDVSPISGGPFTLEHDLGQVVEFRDDPGDWTGPGWFRVLDLTGTGAGGTPEARASIRTCSSDVQTVGDTLLEENGEMANLYRDVNAMVDLDPEAYVDPETGQVRDSCAETGSCDKWVAGNGNNFTRVPDPGRTYSPRIVPIPTFDLAHYNATGRGEIVMTNIFGFFLLHADGPPSFSLQGVLVTQPGLLAGGGGSVDPNSAFTKVVLLIR